jgi:hypothetical protein
MKYEKYMYIFQTPQLIKQRPKHFGENELNFLLSLLDLHVFIQVICDTKCI